MREQPSAPELLSAVAEFMNEPHAPEHAARTTFLRRVAGNVLDIVKRELALGPDADAREAARLRILTGHDGDADTLNVELCDRIAAGDLDLADPALLDHLWASTLDRLAVDQPRYATYQRAAAALSPPSIPSDTKE